MNCLVGEPAVGELGVGELSVGEKSATHLLHINSKCQLIGKLLKCFYT